MTTAHAKSNPAVGLGPHNSRQEWLTVFVCFVVYGALFLDRLAPLFIVSLIAADLGVPSQFEGSVALLIGLGYAAAMPVVRATSGRWPNRPRVVAALTASAILGAVSASAGSWMLFILLRGLSGFVAGTGAPALNVLVFSAAPLHRRGRDLGIVLSSTRWVGSFLAPVIVTGITVAAGWRPALIVSAGILASSIILLTFLAPTDSTSTNRRPDAEPFRLHEGGRRNIALSAVGCTILLTWLVVWSQSSVPLVGDWLSVNPATAGRFAGLFGLSAGVASLAIPLVSDRVGRGRAIRVSAIVGALGAAAVGVLATLEVNPGTLVVGATILLGGVAMGGLPLVLSIVPGEAVASGDVSRGLVVPIASAELLGAALMPALAGWAAATLRPSMVVAMCGILIMGLALLAGALRDLPHPQHTP